MIESVEALSEPGNVFVSSQWQGETNPPNAFAIVEDRDAVRDEPDGGIRSNDAVRR